ncbi:hypothetical protein DPEC_G00036590 [Dallia pectoralis]|uniref:Uncharacterized protein n=1 Tax=Dallia pectoralis TaxID=75939 RepID=A0ACC2HEB3_DALPE|nr:hypothetical protein DPEC_G00036590 [Dallia pectoralis]
MAKTHEESEAGSLLAPLGHFQRGPHPKDKQEALSYRTSRGPQHLIILITWQHCLTRVKPTNKQSEASTSQGTGSRPGAAGADLRIIRTINKRFILLHESHREEAISHQTVIRGRRGSVTAGGIERAGMNRGAMLF